MDTYDVLFIILIFRLCEIIVNPFVKALIKKLKGKKSHSEIDEDSWNASRFLFYAAEAAKKDPDGHVALGHGWLFDKAEMVAELEKALNRISQFYVNRQGMMGGHAVEIAKAALRKSGNF